MNGILVIDKPKGMTSHAVVSRVRTILREPKIGHTGTLDPLATGVLVLCIGKATRIARYLESDEKAYRAELRLGITTDTQDAEGRVLETRSYLPPSRDAIDQALRSMKGRIMQRPPAFSAVKVNGVPSYRLARKGIARELNERPITVHEIGLVGFEDPFLQFDVRCSKGTYVRTLCAEIGSRLGCGAHLSGLVRTRSGRFTLAQAWTLEQLEIACTGDRERPELISLNDAMSDMPWIAVTAEDARRISHGNALDIAPGAIPAPAGVCARLIGPNGGLLAIATCRGGKMHPEVVFSPI